MSIFGTILDKLGFKKNVEKAPIEKQGIPAVKPASTPHPAAPAAPAQQHVPAPQPGPQVMRDSRPAPQPGPHPVPGPQPVPAQRPVPPAAKPAVPPETPRNAMPPLEMPMVDVVSKLDQMAAANPQKLNWKTSIVDLLKLLDIDSSYEARKELAVELGCPPEKMGDSAQMNTWLHKTVMQKLAENGGNIPKELLD